MTGDALPRSTPEEQGISSATLLALVRHWEAAGLGPHSLMVLRHGHLVADGWWAPYERDGLQLVYSVSKTLTACAVGFAVAEGLLRLEDRVVDLFPEAAGVAGPRASRLTLHDLLAMRTGHRADTLVWREGSPTTFPAVFLAQEPEEDPGWFVYHNGATLMAALAVQRASGQPLTGYLRPRLLAPLGVGDLTWLREDGLELGYSGAHVATDTLARLGELILRDGRWQGRQVLPAGWAAAMTSRYTDTSPQPGNPDWQQGYGYQMWHCQHGAIRADGAYGQFAVVVPGADLVVALTSCTGRTQETLDALWEVLLPGLAEHPLPADPAAHAALAEHLAHRSVPAPRSAVHPPGTGPWRFRHEPTEENPRLTAVEVHRDSSSTWRLVVEDGARVEVECGDGAWPAPGPRPWVASGGWTAPGVFEALVTAVRTPHALHLRCADGVAQARWNGVPLHEPTLAAQVAPGL